MKDWRAETAGDLAEARSRLQETLRTISGEPTKEQLHSVWLAYVDIEKSVFFVKVELDAESPGVFVKTSLYRVPDERQAIAFALRSLERGAESLASGDLLDCLGRLRESRNYLRVLLREKRLAGLRRTAHRDRA